MSGFIVYPDQVPPDSKVEAANAERLRQQDITALLVERGNLLAQRERAQTAPREKMGIVVDAQGRDTGMRVRNVTAALHREEVEESVRKIDESLEIVDRELRARDYDGD